MITMTNEKNNSLFNPTLKNDFLSDSISNAVISEETAKSYTRIFHNTFKDENSLKKDLNQFTKEELETVLRGFEANNRNTIESYARIISSYLNWSVQNNRSHVNPLNEFKPSDFEKYIVDNEIYFSDKQLRRYEDKCENYQDAVILRLLFEGISGKQFSEIRNLTVDDIDEKSQTLHLINSLQEGEDGKPVKYTERILKVEQRTIDLINGAIEQRRYIKKNGQMVFTENVRNFTDLVQNKYVIRASITRTDHLNNPVDKFVIFRRMKVLSETLETDVLTDVLTAKFVQRSGMIHYANNLLKGNDDLSLDDFKIVANRFNLKSYHNLKGFLTIEKIRETYPESD